MKVDAGAQAIINAAGSLNNTGSITVASNGAFSNHAYTNAYAFVNIGQVTNAGNFSTFARTLNLGTFSNSGVLATYSTFYNGGTISNLNTGMFLINEPFGNGGRVPTGYATPTPGPAVIENHGTMNITENGSFFNYGDIGNLRDAQ